MSLKYANFRYLNMSSDDETQSACSMINMRADDISILDPFRYFMSAQLIIKWELKESYTNTCTTWTRLILYCVKSWTFWNIRDDPEPDALAEDLKSVDLRDASADAEG